MNTPGTGAASGDRYLAFPRQLLVSITFLLEERQGSEASGVGGGERLVQLSKGHFRVRSQTMLHLFSSEWQMRLMQHAALCRRPTHPPHVRASFSQSMEAGWASSMT